MTQMPELSPAPSPLTRLVLLRGFGLGAGTSLSGAVAPRPSAAVRSTALIFAERTPRY